MSSDSSHIFGIDGLSSHNSYGSQPIRMVRRSSAALPSQRQSLDGVLIRPRGARRLVTARTDPTPLEFDGSPSSPDEASQTFLLAGELDAATAARGRRQLRSAVRTGHGPLVLDCSAVQFIDAAWLGVLVGTARYGNELGRKVMVVNPSDRMSRLLRLLGLQWLTGLT
jgi:anti-sigma B factor antagonist